jgi:hypothetical protein
MSSTVKIARKTTAKVHGMLVTEVIVTVMTVLLSCSETTRRHATGTAGK